VFYTDGAVNSQLYCDPPHLPLVHTFEATDKLLISSPLNLSPWFQCKFKFRGLYKCKYNIQALLLILRRNIMKYLYRMATQNAYEIVFSILY